MPVIILILIVTVMPVALTQSPDGETEAEICIDTARLEGCPDQMFPAEYRSALDTLSRGEVLLA